MPRRRQLPPTLSYLSHHHPGKLQSGVFDTAFEVLAKKTRTQIACEILYIYGVLPRSNLSRYALVTLHTALRVFSKKVVLALPENIRKVYLSKRSLLPKA
jgi:hypothetical protein